MKKLLLTFAALAVTLASSFGQGQLFFNNRVAGSYVNRAVFQGTTEGVPGPQYQAQLVMDAGGTFTPIGSPVAFRPAGANAGLMIGGQTLTVPGVAEGAKATFRLVVIEGTAFSTAAIRGQSVAQEFTLGGSLITPPNTQFGGAAENINVVPEPSTIALGILGAAALLLRRRK